MSLLRELNRLGVLRPLDDALAQSLRRLDPDTPDEVLAAAALASLAVASGHAAFDPARPRQLSDADLPWPNAGAWRQTLAASRWVATPDASDDVAAAAPLALEYGLLYLRRYREYERRLALQLRRIAVQPPVDADIAAVAPLFATLFPGSTSLLPHAGEGVRRVDEGALRSTAPHPGPLPHAGEGATAPDHQARAAALALRRALLLVTGGPGTGKTTTIARLLVLRIAQVLQAGHPPPRIALAAPTGRAAERMAESLRRAAQQMAALGVDADLLAALPLEASTLHRLLGALPDVPRFRHHADHPLPFDIVVVDEASMVDLPLMCKLAEAVPAHARLILLGDRDQLPSVEAGNVLAAIDDAADDADGEAAADGSAGHDPGCAAVPALSGHRVRLTRGYRQSAALDLAPLAEAARAGDAEQALALLRDGSLAGVTFHEGLADPLQDATREALLSPWRALQDCADPREALALAARTRLLTALRDGPQGAVTLNDRIEEALAGPRRAPYFHGRLLLVTENSYRHGLFNGDIGVCLRDGDGATQAWFAGGTEGVRRFHPAALPAHAGAFAMTVHKAQGSEFDAVWLLLPRHDARALSRELLYTALTRARHALHVCAGEAALRSALGRHVVRVSGLAARLSPPAAQRAD